MNRLEFYIKRYYNIIREELLHKIPGWPEIRRCDELNPLLRVLFIYYGAEVEEKNQVKEQYITILHVMFIIPFMDINFLIIGIVVIAGLFLLVWLIRQNLKDKKEFEKNSNLSELKPDLHKPDKI